MDILWEYSPQPFCEASVWTIVFFMATKFTSYFTFPGCLPTMLIPELDSNWDEPLTFKEIVLLYIYLLLLKISYLQKSRHYILCRWAKWIFQTWYFLQGHFETFDQFFAFHPDKSWSECWFFLELQFGCLIEGASPRSKHRQRSSYN